MGDGALRSSEAITGSEAHPPHKDDDQTGDDYAEALEALLDVARHQAEDTQTVLTSRGARVTVQQDSTDALGE
jgi:hypothetical protein